MGPKKQRKSIDNNLSRLSRAGTEPLPEAKPHQYGYTNSRYDRLEFLYEDESQEGSFYDYGKSKSQRSPTKSLTKITNTSRSIKCQKYFSLGSQLYPLYKPILYLIGIFAFFQSQHNLHRELSNLQTHLNNLTISIQFIQDELGVLTQGSANCSNDMVNLNKTVNNIFKFIKSQQNSHIPSLSSKSRSNGPELDQPNISQPRVKIETGVPPRLKDEINILRSLFPNQFRETWVGFYAGVSTTFEENSDQPGSILILAPPNQQEGVKCFGKTLGHSLNTVSTSSNKIPLMTQESDLHNLKTLDIRTDVEKYFQEGGKCVIFNDVELVEDKDFLMFLHALTDNRNPINSKAVFISTATVPEDIYGKYEWTPDNALIISREVLRLGWSRVLPKDDISPLISRIAVNVVLYVNKM